MRVVALFFAVLLGLVVGVDGGVRVSYHKPSTLRSFDCRDGSKKLDAFRVNDGSCDCEDGSDEPDSNHCEHKRFKCAEDSKLIFKSRVNDGVCDCCDGSDENAEMCQNQCLNKNRPNSKPAALARTQHKAALTPVGDDDSISQLSRHPHKDLETHHAHDKVSAIEKRDDVGDSNESGDDINANTANVVPDEVVQQLTQPENPTTIRGHVVDDEMIDSDNFDPSVAEAYTIQHTPSHAEEALIEEPQQVQGYYQQPVMYGDRVVFVSEDDLWTVTLTNPKPTRLTSGLGQVWRPRISPDGRMLAFSGSDEGSPDVYVMPFEGGSSRRLTYTGSAMVVSWTLDGQGVVFATQNSHFHDGQNEELFEVPVTGGQPQPLGVGWSNYLSYGAVWCSFCSKPDHPCASSPQGCKEECEQNTYRGCVFNKDYEGFVKDKSYEGQPMQPMTILGRHISDIGRWKRYRGGQRGRLWVDMDGSQHYEPLVDLKGNIGHFVWARSFAVFTSDDHCQPHANDQCVANLYMVEINPGDEHATPQERLKARIPKQVTFFKADYVRYPTVSWSQGDVYVSFTVGADMYYVTVSDEGQVSEPKLIKVTWTSPRQQRQRRFLPVTSQISQYALSPDASQVALLARGRPFLRSAREDGASVQYGATQGVRYSHIDFLPSGDLLAVSDENSEGAIVLFKTHGERQLSSVSLVGDTVGHTVGRIELFVTSPVHNMVAFVNHQFQLTVLDVSRSEIVCTLRSSYDPGIEHVSWSPDGNWIAFTYYSAPEVSVIKIMRVREGKSYTNEDVCGVVDVTDPLVRDHSPTWDRDGKFLYFLSTRDFNPIPDEVSQRSMAFVGATRPFLVTLNGADRTPFRTQKWDSEDVRSIVHRMQKTQSQEDTAATKSEVLIDTTSIKNRILGFPVSPGDYIAILGMPGKRVLYIRQPLEPDLSRSYVLYGYDFVLQQEVPLADNIVRLSLSHDGAYVAVSSLAMSAPVCVAPSEFRGPLRGDLLQCVDTHRVEFEVQPPSEWRQLLLETWRRARDNFWTGSMNGLDWERVRDKYLPLVDRIATRSELTDVIYQLQGELGTSHAFHKGYAHRSGTAVNVGRLGCDVEWDMSFSGYRVTALYKGDMWSTSSAGPLTRPGINVEEGDVILKINGRDVSEKVSLDEILLGKADAEVELTFLKFKRKAVQVQSEDGSASRGGVIRVPLFPVTVTVTPIMHEGMVRYRDWVNKNRQYIHAKSNGRIGYIHVPDMLQDGFAEFHRSYITQANREALIIDVRYNSGGYISENLLDKLSRKTLGFVKSRWGVPEPYPHYSTSGPKVVLINEGCGSDCDIFAHNFCARMSYAVPCLHTQQDIQTHCKLMGERTWGGVIGIDWKGKLADFSATSQPEYAHWFVEGGWKVENTGVVPDVEVLYQPQDYVTMYRTGQYEDPQLKAAYEHIHAIIDSAEFKQRRETCVPDIRLGERA